MLKSFLSGIASYINNQPTTRKSQVCSKFSTELLQVDCQNLLSTGLLQVVSTSCNKRDFNTNLLQLDEIDKFVATCYK